MSTLTRDAILAIDDTKYLTVSVPEWGGDVRLRTLSGADRAALIASYNDETHAGKFDIFLVTVCMVDDNGDRIFSVKDVDALAKRSAKALLRIAEEAKKLNGLSVSSEDDAEKN